MGFLEGSINLLSKEELDLIHAASLEILEKIGMRIEHRKMLQLLDEWGANVDYNSYTAKFPADLVEELLKKIRESPPVVGTKEIVSARDNKSRKLEAVVGGFCTNIHDMDTNEIRKATKKDLENATIIGGALEEVTLIGALFNPQDVPIETSDVHMWDVILRRSTKVIGPPPILNLGSVKHIFDLCSVVAGSSEEIRKQRMFYYDCYTSAPLMLSRYALDIAFEVRKAGMPVLIGGSMVIPGTSGPITLAGSLIISNAESLAGVIMTHLLGCDPAYFAVNVTMNQHSGFACYASPDKILMSIATIEFGQYYNLPATKHFGFADSHIPDIQAGVEKAYTALLTLFTGSASMRGTSVGNIIAGQNGGGKTGSLPQIVIDAEICNMFNRLMRGITVNKETMALDLIKKIGIGGNFMTEEHTLKHFREEMWFSKVFVRESSGEWMKDKRGARENAKDKVKQILKTHDPHPLEEAQEREISRIVKAANGKGGEK